MYPSKYLFQSLVYLLFEFLGFVQILPVSCGEVQLLRFAHIANKDGKLRDFFGHVFPRALLSGRAPGCWLLLPSPMVTEGAFPEFMYCAADGAGFGREAVSELPELAGAVDLGEILMLTGFRCFIGHGVPLPR